MCKKYYIWNPAICSCKNGKYLASVIDDSGIACDEIIDTTKTLPTNINVKKIICETKIFYYFTQFFINYHSIIDSC